MRLGKGGIGGGFSIRLWEVLTNEGELTRDHSCVCVGLSAEEYVISGCRQADGSLVSCLT